eukprot:CAMPEP_0177624854 /NCGR_PEP_ID=MMETSP0419_2-20121207/29741_1 /TAXON_ID=582737 /ORGANISM="Tetraselmis sp., Strain GSL018" /LENGTH=75 /DNA_ID=CAMNT_0019125667 /DNA_START=176 /DNA_END=400 /DNA_ORIENTATION=-
MADWPSNVKKATRFCADGQDATPVRKQEPPFPVPENEQQLVYPLRFIIPRDLGLLVNSTFEHAKTSIDSLVAVLW